MKKKIVLLAAFAAVTTAFVGCSSDETLASQNATEPPVAEGIPLTVKLVDGDGTTRGTDLTATTLTSFSLYSVKHGGTERWLGTYEAGVSTGATFTGANGTFTNSDGIKWKSGAWDFYALSDPSFASEDDGNGGTQDAEHLDDATNPNFTYTVSNDYAAQKDLLVAAATNQTATTNSGNVVLPFYHALARIKSVKLKFKATSESNDNYIFIIKSMTLKNIPSTAKFTFPEEWKKANLATAWGTATGLKDYILNFPDFERDVNGNIKIFEENQDEDKYENTGTAYAETKRGGITGFPNFITFPDDVTTTYEFPLATTEGVGDDGLYIMPQTLEKTKLYVEDLGSAISYHFNTDAGNNTYTTPYLEVTFLGLTDSSHDSSDPTSLADFASVSEEYGGSSTRTGNWTNARITEAINNDDLYTVAIPLSALTFEAGKYYSLVAYISMAVDQNDGDVMIFSGAGLE